MNKARMFNRKASDPKNKPDQILESLSLQQGQTIADIGAGGGYFSLRFANEVGSKGRVYAVDTNAEFLEFVNKRADEKGLTNVKTILATQDNPLPEKSLDLVFMRNVTHHLTNRVEYFKKLKRVLKPKGKVAIIEYRRGGGFFSFHRIFGHYVPKETLMQEMVEAGYRLEKDFDFLPEQSFTIFLRSF